LEKRIFGTIGKKNIRNHWEKEYSEPLGKRIFGTIGKTNIQDSAASLLNTPFKEAEA
jgi:hypothetical protein